MPDINSSDIQSFKRMLDESRSTVIVTHMRPDGDAVGSCIAAHSFIKACGKQSTIVLPHNCPANIDFLIEGISEKELLTYESKPKESSAAIEKADLVICLDFNAFHRTDHLESVLASSHARKVLIDHHLNPDRECFSLVFSETEVSSASELLFHILMRMPEIEGDAGRLPKRAAEALMTGMTTDTNNFGNSVYPSTLQMASALLAAGTDRDRILSMLYNRFSEMRLRLMGHMMKDLLKITDDGVAYIILDSSTQKEYHIGEGDTEGFVNMPLSIDKVKMSIFLKEDEDRLRVSIRSKKGISANRCARQYFNGGGHENAAGGRLRIPEDVTDIFNAGAYIEEHTHTFMTDEN